VVRDPSAIVTGASDARVRALSGLASLLTEAPWTLDAEDTARVRAAGVSEEGLVQAVTITAVFNYLPRVADGTGIEYDYESPLDRLKVDTSIDALPRPPRDEWPRVPPGTAEALSLRPATAGAFDAWKAYIFGREAPLSRRDRAVIARVAAASCCDATEVTAFAGNEPANAREEALAAYAHKLSLTPWRMAPGDLGPLRAHGLDDAGILDVIAVTAFENAYSRLRFGLAAV
jgi:alkylhydroperoxidase family enzyme